MTRPMMTERERRMDAIIHRLTHARDEALTIIEAHLGLTPRPDGHDAGRPWVGGDSPSRGSPSLKP
jgi:hypothetical protein